MPTIVHNKAYVHRRNLRAGRETGQGTAGQDRDDVRAAEWEDQVDVSSRLRSYTSL